MRKSREEIYQTFFDFIKDAAVFQTASRRTQIFSNVTPEMQPALYMEQIGENPVQVGHGMPYQWHLDVMLGIYVFAGAESVAPASLLNPILDAIENKLDPTIPQTLGGLVYDAKLKGEGKMHAGAIGPQAFAFIPATIIML